MTEEKALDVDFVKVNYLGKSWDGGFVDVSVCREELMMRLCSSE